MKHWDGRVIFGTLIIAVIAMLGTARASTEIDPAQAKPPARGAAPIVVAGANPPQAEIDECNREANAVQGDRTKNTVTDAVIGGAGGAGLGAAGGAIAGGGGGAGKGAGIGALVGAAAGTLYGLSSSNQDAESSRTYRACMQRKGYAD